MRGVPTTARILAVDLFPEKARRVLEQLGGSFNHLAVGGQISQPRMLRNEVFRTGQKDRLADSLTVMYPTVRGRRPTSDLLDHNIAVAPKIFFF